MLLTKGCNRSSLLGAPTTQPSDLRVPRKRSYDAKTHKKCIVCRVVKELGEFGQHDDNHDGKQVICYECKNQQGKVRRDKNVRMKLRHHMATRMKAQLGELCPDSHTKDLEHYLGYSLSELVRSLADRLKQDYPDEELRLRDVLNAGWHVDHIYPLSRFNVVNPQKGAVDWEEFKRCWAIDNLRAIPAEENLAKGAKVEGNPM